MTCKKYIIIFGLVFIVLHAKGQLSTPVYSNDFLETGIGARAIGMGNAHIAMAGDVTAAYWNPAGLLNIEKNYQLALMHGEYLAGRSRYNYAGFATPVDSASHIAITAIRSGSYNPDTRNLIDTDNNNIRYDNINDFTTADYAFLLSYAKAAGFLKGLDLGANLKLVYRNAGVFGNAFGIGLDAGAQYKIKTWRLGITLSNITGTYNIWSINTETLREVYQTTGTTLMQKFTEVTLPAVTPGVARKFKLFDNLHLYPALDIAITFDGKRNTLISGNTISLAPRAGIELNYNEFIYLRFGGNQIQQKEDVNMNTYTDTALNMGLGICYKDFYVDYALRNFNNYQASLYSNIFSLKYGFD